MSVPSPTRTGQRAAAPSRPVRGQPTIAVTKVVGGLLSGSVAMPAEAARSIADTMDQIFLRISLSFGERPADERLTKDPTTKVVLFEDRSAGAGRGGLVTRDREIARLHHDRDEFLRHNRRRLGRSRNLLTPVHPATTGGMPLVRSRSVASWYSWPTGLLATREASFWAKPRRSSRESPDDGDQGAPRGVAGRRTALTMMIGPHSILVAVRADLREDLGGRRIEEVRGDIERDARRAVPEVRQFVLDPTSGA